MTDPLENDLSELDRLRAEVRLQREELDRLASGLAVLTRVSTVDELSSVLFEAYRPWLGFTDACVVRQSEGHEPVVLTTTNLELDEAPWRHEQLERSESGPRSTAYDALSSFFLNTPISSSSLASSSALYLDISDERRRAGVCFLHPAPGFFDAESVRRAEVVRPLFALALRAVTALELETEAHLQTHAELDAAMARFSAVVSHMRSGLLVEDLDGRIALVNDAFRRQFGIDSPTESLLGMPTMSTVQEHASLLVDVNEFPPQRPDPAPPHGATPSKRIELRNRRTLESSYVPIHQGSERIGALRQFDDITERLAAESRLEAATAQAQAANTAKTSFLANISHDIRTPLNAMLGMTTLMLGTTLQPEQRRYLRSMRRNSETLLQLLGDVLDFTRMESDEVELDEVAFDFARVVEDTLELRSPRARAKRLELSAEVQPDFPPCIIGDLSRTRQVILNLVDSAIESTEDGFIAVGLRADRVAPGRTSVSMTVTHDGSNVAPEALEDVLGELSTSRLDSSRSKLGLALAQQLIELMGGRLEVEPDVVNGSTLVLQCEFAVGRSHDDVLRRARAVATGWRAWVIHRSERIRSALRRALETLGVQTQAAHDVQSVEFLLEGAQRQFLLLDNFYAQESKRVPLPTILVQGFGGSDTAGSEESHRVLGSPTRHAIWESVRDVIGSMESSGATSSRARAPRILVVEDNLDNQLVAVTLLRRLDYEVRIASTGQKGLEAMEIAPADLVLLDIDLPDISGLEVAQQIRRGPHGPFVSILAFTSHATEQMRRACLDAGTDGFLAKPLAPDVLLDTVAHQLSKRTPRVLVASTSSVQRERILMSLQGKKLELFEATTEDQLLQEAIDGLLDLVIIDDSSWKNAGSVAAIAELRRLPSSREISVLLLRGKAPGPAQALLADDPHVAIVESTQGPEKFWAEVQALLEGRFPAIQAPPRGSSGPSDRESRSPPAEPADPELKEFIPRYVERSLAALENAERSLLEGNLDRVRRVAHQIKGTGTSFGFPLVTAVAARLEKAAREEDAANAAELIRALRHHLGPFAPT